MTSESQLLANPNEPLGGVVLVPFNGISVVHWELMVEIVITFADGYQRRCEMVSWGVLVIERSFTQPMSKRVNTERRLYVKFFWLVKMTIRKRYHY